MRLIRIEQNDDVTIGVLTYNGNILCYTLERPYILNAKNYSCIPKGDYVCSKIESPKFGETFKVEVEGRTDILFHPGNMVADSHGCILLGTELSWFQGDTRAVRYSKKAFAILLDKLEGKDSFRLEVLEV